MSNYLFSSFNSNAAAASTTQPPPPPGVAATSAQHPTIDIYWPKSATQRYLSSSQDLTSKYLSGSEILRYYSTPSSRLTGGGAPATSYLGSESSFWTGFGYGSSGVKRAAAADSIYNPNVLGAQNTSGQYEAWYTGNSLDKRPRLESASNLPIYPQRPGEKDCVYYMQTRTCKFGDSCKFDHPIWVPEGGIPDWKELPPASEILPERPGEPDCPYFLKTTKCKFGMNCKFNHPKNEVIDVGALENNTAELPQRPTETPCAFYMKTGTCKFGASCKFHHPKDIQIPPAGQETGIGDLIKSTSQTNGAAGDSKPANSHPILIPVMGHNSKGLPMRMGAEDCPFYMKTGSCKYGVSCRYNHPERNVISPPVRAIGNPFVSSSTPSLNIGVVNPAASIYQNMDPGFTQPMLGVGTTLYPQRPGQTECDYYMKTGLCKFGEACKFHHPIDRSAPLAKAGQLGVKLTPAGLPRREGAAICAFYLKTCTCKFGAACKFDHPPPGEVLAMAALQATSSVEEVKGNEKDAQTDQEN